MAKVDVNLKAEAVTMLAQFSDTVDYVKILNSFSCEKLLISILRNEEARSRVRKATLRALTVLHSVWVIFGLHVSTSIYALREPEGLDTLFILLRESTEGTIRNEDD